jgi:hypothetical protein
MEGAAMSIVTRASAPIIVKLLAITLGVSLGANVIGGLWIWVLRSEAYSADTKLDAATDANAGNVATINAQRDALEACVGLDQFVIRLAEQASADYAAAKALRDQAAADSAAERNRIYETDPTCRDWAAAPVCAAISDGL